MARSGLLTIAVLAVIMAVSFQEGTCKWNQFQFSVFVCLNWLRKQKSKNKNNATTKSRLKFVTKQKNEEKDWISVSERNYSHLI